MKKTLLIFFFCLLGPVLLCQTVQPWLEKKVSISVKNKALEDVLKGLEGDLDGMVFAYLPGSFDVSRKVTVKLDSVSLKEVLEEVFADQYVECSEMRGKIFLKRKKKEPGQKSGKPSQKRRRRSVGGVMAESSSTGQEAHGFKVSTAADEAKTDGGSLASISSSVKENATNKKTAIQNETVPSWIAGLELTNSEKSQTVIKNAAAYESDDLNSAATEFDPDSMAMATFEPAQVPELLQVSWRGGSLPSQADLSRQYVPPLPISFTEAEEKKSFWSWLKWPAFLTKDSDKAAREKKAASSVKQPEAFIKKGFRAYIATSVGISPVGGENALKIGGRLVWQQKPSLGLGVAGYAIVGSTISLTNAAQDFRIAGGYGGFHMEYTLNPDAPLHISFPMLFAIGEVTYVDTVGGLPIPGIQEDGTKNIMVLEPGVMLEMNALSFLKLGLNVTYRYTSNSTVIHANREEIVSSNGLNGITAGITIKIGRF